MLPEVLRQEIREYLLAKVREKYSNREQLRLELEDQDLPFHRRLLYLTRERMN